MKTLVANETKTRRGTRRIAMAAALLAAGVLLARGPQAVAAPSLADAPAAAPVVLIVPDTAASWAKAAKLPLVQAALAFIKSPEITGKTDYQSFQLELSKLEQALGYPVTGDELLGNVFSSIQVLGMPPATGKSEPELAISLGVKDAAKAGKILDLLETQDSDLVKMLQGGDASSTATVNTVEKLQLGGARAVKLSHKTETMSEAETIFCALNDKLLVVAASQPLLEQNLAAAATGPKLDGNAVFASLKDKIKLNDADIQLWVDSDAMQAGSPQLAMLKGFPGVSEKNKGIVAVNIVENGLESDIASTADPTQLLPNVKPMPLKGLGMLPEQPLAAASYGLVDAKAFNDMANKALAMMGGGSESPLAAFETATGISIENDLVPAVGQEGIFSLNNFQMNPLIPIPLVDLTLAVQVRDEAKMKGVLGKLEKYMEKQAGGAAAMMGGGGGGATPAPPVFKGVNTTHGEVRTLETALPILQPSYAIKGGFVVWGLSETSVESALGRMDAPVAAGDAKAFRTLATAENTFAAGSVDIKGMVEKIVAPYVGMAGGSEEAQIGLKFMTTVLAHAGTLDAAERLDGQTVISKMNLRMQ